MGRAINTIITEHGENKSREKSLDFVRCASGTLSAGILPYRADTGEVLVAIMKAKLRNGNKSETTPDKSNELQILGGKMQGEESAGEGAEREFREETGDCLVPIKFWKTFAGDAHTTLNIRNSGYSLYLIDVATLIQDILPHNIPKEFQRRRQKIENPATDLALELVWIKPGDSSSYPWPLSTLCNLVFRNSHFTSFMNSIEIKKNIESKEHVEIKEKSVTPVATEGYYVLQYEEQETNDILTITASIVRAADGSLFRVTSVLPLPMLDRCSGEARQFLRGSWIIASGDIETPEDSAFVRGAFRDYFYAHNIAATDVHDFIDSDETSLNGYTLLRNEEASSEDFDGEFSFEPE